MSLFILSSFATDLPCYAYKSVRIITVDNNYELPELFIDLNGPKYYLIVRA